MAGQTHLRLLPAGPGEDRPRCSWITLQDGRGLAGPRHGELADAAASIDTDQVIVYVPTLEVFLTRVKLPAGRRSQLQHALPYALEESLTEDVDELHCALGAQQEDGRHGAAVVRRRTLGGWLESLAQAGIAPRAMYPDVMLLPRVADGWAISCLENRLHVRTGADDGFVCEAAMLPRLLEKALARQGAPQQVHTWGCDAKEQDILQGLLPEGCDIVSHTVAADATLLSLVAEAPHGPGSSLNLLQGDYAPRSRIRQQLRPWYPTAALAAGLLLVGLLGNVVEYVSLSRHSAQLEQQIRQIFKKTFPDVKRIVNPQAQMKHRLAQLRGSGQGGPAFAEVLAGVAPLVSGTPGTRVRYVRYQQGQMELMLDLPDLQTLENLKNRINADTDWQADIKSANSSDNKVQGRLLIYRKG